MDDETAIRAAVVGNGPVGLATAVLLATLGVPTALLAPPLSRPDTRTAGLFAGSVALLRNLDIWAELQPACAPITGIRLVDSQPHLFRAPEVLFPAAELDMEAFGYNVPNAALTSALSTAARSHPRLKIIERSAQTVALDQRGATITLDDGTHLRASAIIGADGRNSIVRTAAGIATKTWDYPQAAVVTSFAHQRAHGGVSTEFHRTSGPLTTVPMPGRRSSLVWVENRAEAARLSALPDTAFAYELEMHLGGLLGSINDIAPRASFPLAGLSAEVMGRGVVGLVGEAAHVMPPIGAQGLNLGLRDAAALAERLADAAPGTAGAEAAIAQYARDRQLDVASRIAAIDALNRSLLTGFLPVHLMRGFGIFALKASAPLRRLVVREGLQPSIALPRAMQPGGLIPNKSSTTTLGAP